MNSIPLKIFDVSNHEYRSTLKEKEGKQMIGTIIGDIVGSRFEFNNYRSKNFELFTKECRVTDDSIMTLAVAKAFMESGRTIQPAIDGAEYECDKKLENMAIAYMQELGRKYPNCGLEACSQNGFSVKILSHITVLEMDQRCE